ncbi:MAG: CpsB/CapC family capsule biosynthesis tyrosine phosphatase, partial [Actinomycetota bacterium]
MAGYVDMHSHVVFGVDDGAESLAHAVELVTAARDAGTRLLVATPHVAPPYLDWNASAARLGRIQRRFALLRDAAPPGAPGAGDLHGGPLPGARPPEPAGRGPAPGRAHRGPVRRRAAGRSVGEGEG